MEKPSVHDRTSRFRTAADDDDNDDATYLKT